jgi:serine/threonine-protein kinase RsbW
LELHALAEVSRVLTAVAADMTALNYGSRDIFAVKLGLEEAISNAVKHGNRRDPAKRVRIRYRVTADRVVAEVADEGAGFDPAAVPDPRPGGYRDRPCGRGLFLMRAYMTWVAFNARGNEVTLCRLRGHAA